MILRSSVRALGFFAALISLASPTRGEPAREMVGKCRLTVASLQVEAEHVMLPNTESAGWCWGAFEVLQRLIVYSDQSNQHLFRICAPPESTRVQIINIFLAYAKRHPEQLDQEFTDVALDSLIKSFPCK